jgi:hypothetical protein
VADSSGIGEKKPPKFRLAIKPVSIPVRPDSPIISTRQEIVSSKKRDIVQAAGVKRVVYPIIVI